VYRLLSPRNKSHGNQLLSDHEENQLLALLRVLARAGTAWTQSQIIHFVRDYTNKPDTWSGWSFIAGFLFRHKDLVVPRSPKPTDIKRLQLKMSDIEQFIEKAGSVLSEFKGDPNLIINVDETFAMSNHIRHPDVIVPAETVKACISQSGYDSLRSIVPFLGAGGRVWAVFFIFKKKPESKSKSILKQLIDDRSPKSYSLFFATSKSGLVTKKLWKSIIERFVEVLKPQIGKAGAILLLDHLVSHEEGSSLRLLEQNKINTLFFIPHSSHILQPADNVAFALLKRTIYNEVHSLLQTYLANKVGPKFLIQQVIIEAIRKSLTKDTICASFRNTGIFPFDAAVIRANANAQLGTEEEPQEAPIVPPEVRDMEKTIEKMFTRHEVHRKITKVALEEEERAILLEEVLAKQDAIEAAKQQANDEAEEKRNLKKRKQEEREEMKAAKKAARKFCGACDKRYGNGRDWKECSTCTAALFCVLHQSRLFRCS
jgi:hypothetical protein